MIYIYNLIGQKNVHRFNLLLFINLSDKRLCCKTAKSFLYKSMVVY